MWPKSDRGEGHKVRLLYSSLVFKDVIHVSIFVQSYLLQENYYLFHFFISIFFLCFYRLLILFKARSHTTTLILFTMPDTTDRFVLRTQAHGNSFEFKIYCHKIIKSVVVIKHHARIQK